MNSNNTPLVSILIPSYNHEKYIEQCIMSVINQTYTNIEIVVIDDGSSDNSHVILDNLKTKHNFTYIRQSNIGLLKTLNQGIKKYVCGKYLCLLASDDYWCLDKLEKQIAFMELHNDISVCCGNALIINETGEVLPSCDQQFHQAGEVSFAQLLETNTICALTVMFRSEIMEKVGYYDDKYRFEDWPMWLKLTNLGHHIWRIDDTLGYYRRHSNNTTSPQNSLSSLDEMELIIEPYQHHSSWLKAISSIVYNKVKASLELNIPSTTQYNLERLRYLDKNLYKRAKKKCRSFKIKKIRNRIMDRIKALWRKEPTF